MFIAMWWYFFTEHSYYEYAYNSYIISGLYTQLYSCESSVFPGILRLTAL